MLLWLTYYLLLLLMLAGWSSGCACTQWLNVNTYSEAADTQTRVGMFSSDQDLWPASTWLPVWPFDLVIEAWFPVTTNLLISWNIWTETWLFCLLTLQDQRGLTARPLLLQPKASSTDRLTARPTCPTPSTEHGDKSSAHGPEMVLKESF